MEKGKGSSTAALGFTRSSGLSSVVYFFSTQLRTLPPWLLKVTWNRSVSMEKPGSTLAWVTGAVAGPSASGTTSVGGGVSEGAAGCSTCVVGAVAFFAGVVADGKK